MKWSIDKSSFHFESLYIHISRLHPNPPNCPVLTPMDQLSDISLAIYRLNLQKYLNQIFNRPDIFNCQFIQEYFEFNQFIQKPNHCTLIAKSDINNMEIFDLCISSEHNILFCSGGKDIPVISSISTINTLFSYFEENGFVKIYQINEGAYGEVKLDVILNKRFSCQISNISFEDSNSYLTLGFFDGSIEIDYFNHLALHKIALLKPHTHKIINIYCDYIKGYIYSAAYNENLIIISELNYQKTIASFTISNSNLNSFTLLSIDQKIICADDDGTVWLYQFNLQNNTRIKLLQAIHGQLEKISALNALEEPNLIFVANAFKIGLYEYKENAKSSIVEINQRLLFATSSGVNHIAYELDKGMIITACDNGTVQFWTNNVHCPEYVLESHTEKVSSFVFETKNNLLYTCSYDKTIKIWALPDKWTSEIYRKNQLINEESVVANVTDSLKSINKLKEALRSDAFKLAFEDENSINQKEEREETNNFQLQNKDKNNKEENSDGVNSLDGWDEVIPQVLNKQFKP